MSHLVDRSVWQRLLVELPSRPSDAELILRSDPRGPTATLRRDGAPPRIFLDAAEGVRELQPGEDAGLPGAALIADSRRAAALLGPQVGELRTVDLVAWRPGRRAVLRVTAADGRVHWLKLLDRKGYRRAVATFAALGHALAPLQLAIPQQLFDGECACLLPNAEGRPLRDLLATAEPVPMATTTRALLALSYTELRGELPILDFARAQTATVDMLRKGMAGRPALAEIATAITRLPAVPMPERPGFVHGDLHDKQLFVTATGVTLIDLEGAAVGDGRFDLANLAEHVRLRDLQQHGTDRGLADHLLARCGLDGDDAPIRAFRTLVRARLCGVYALRPRWHDLVTRMQNETLSLVESLA